MATKPKTTKKAAPAASEGPTPIRFHNSEAVHDSVLKLETLTAAAAAFIEDFDYGAGMDECRQKSVSRLTMITELLEDECDALRFAIWGEGRSP